MNAKTGVQAAKIEIRAGTKLPQSTHRGGKDRNKPGQTHLARPSPPKRPPENPSTPSSAGCAPATNPDKTVTATIGG